MKQPCKFRVRPDSRNPRLRQVESDAGHGYRPVIVGLDDRALELVVRPLVKRGVKVEGYAVEVDQSR